jgi:hypothetical protein
LYALLESCRTRRTTGQAPSHEELEQHGVEMESS